MTRSMRIMFLVLIAGLAVGLIELRVKNDALAGQVKTSKTTQGAE
ncbi:MAG: hypothetical protein ACOZQL_09005 [Myxococcota bacterium]